MFKDAKKELERLQDELLAEEAPEDLPEEPQTDDDLLSEQVLDQLLDTDYRSYNTDKTDLDPMELSRELDTPEKSPLTGLIVAVSLISAASLLVVIWWLMRYGGIL